MFCELCGSELDDTFSCPGCGTPRSARAPQLAGTPASRVDERRQLTVVFCDLVGSTALSEQMDPEDFQSLLQDYQSQCAAIVREHRGYVAQFLGDGILAYFGYPVATERTPVDAVEAGLDLVQAVTTLPAPVPLKARVGIHSGVVVVSEMGDSSVPQRLAVGATPNVAARAQAEAENNSVFITETTHRLVEGYFECEDAGERELRGVSRPVRFFRVDRRSEVVSRVDQSMRRGLSRFIGRDEELVELERVYHARGNAGPRGVVLVGEPGIGKSRLAHEFSARLAPVRILDCSGQEYHESDAFFPVLRLLDTWAEEQTGSDPAALTQAIQRIGLGDYGTELDTLRSVSRGELRPAVALPTARVYQRTLEALTRFLGALCQQRPSIVLAEDVQWLDPSTRALLASLAESAAVPFVLATTRPDGDVAWAREAGLHILELSRLDATTATEMAMHVAESVHVQLSPEVMEQLVGRAEGVPLFVEETTLAWVESRSAAASLDASPSSVASIPDTLRDPLTARLDRLGAARPLAQTASVLGRQFPLPWLAELVGMETEAVAAALLPLLSAGVIYGLAGTDATYAFSHAMIRDAAYESLTRRTRSAYHRRTATMIASRYSDVAARDPLLVAHHSAEGGDVAMATDHLLLAARRALASAAFVEALEITTRGLELIRRAPDPSQFEATEVELLTTRGFTLICTQGYTIPEVEELYARAVQICERTGDVPLHVLYGVWAFHLVRANPAQVTRLVRLFEPRLADCPKDETVVVRACLGAREFFSVKLDPARTHLEASVSALDTENLVAQHRRLVEHHRFEGTLAAHLWLSWVDLLEGHVRVATESMTHTWALAERIGDPYMSCQVAVHNASLCRELGDVARAEFFLQQAFNLMADNEYMFWLALALCARAWLQVERGRPEEALGDVTQGLAILDAIGLAVNRGYFQTYLVQAYLACAQYENAIAAADHGLVICRGSIGPMYEPELLRQRALALSQLGDRAAAEAHYREALALSREQGVRLIELSIARDLATLLAHDGRESEGRQIFDSACAAWPEGPEAPYVRRVRDAFELARHSNEPLMSPRAES